MAKKAFTTIELIVAVSLLAVVMAICGAIFNISTKAQRQATAVTEITRNFRAITDQINRDFSGLVKDGYLVLRSEEVQAYLNQADLDNSTNAITVRRDNIIFFATGDFQSIKPPDYNKSNISLIYYGPEDAILAESASANNNPVDKICPEWIFVRAPMMLLPQAAPPTLPADDYFDASMAAYKSNIVFFKDILSADLDGYTYPKFLAVDSSDENTLWKYFVDGVGSVKIEWTYGTTDAIATDSLAWIGLGSLVNDSSNIDPNNFDSSTPGSQGFADDSHSAIGETVTPTPIGEFYTAEWGPNDTIYWPKAIKFTITLYDSRGVVPDGKVFTHIVYIGD